MDAHEAYNLATDYYTQWKTQVDTALVILGTALAVLWVNNGCRMPTLKMPRVRIPFYGRWRAMRVAKTAREERNMSLIADGITDMLEDHIAKGRLTSKEADYYYRLFAHRGKIKDLLPRSQIEVLNRLKRERDTRDILKAKGEYKYPSIPGPMPPQDNRNILMLSKLELAFKKKPVQTATLQAA
jgi:hypothetical protein